MAKRYPGRRGIRGANLPRLVLLSDARNDAALERALARLPAGSALVFRHYHLDAPARRARWASLRRLARAHGVRLVLAGKACGPGAQGCYAAPSRLGRAPGARQGGLRLATAHSLREIAGAVRARADAVLLSPVHATRSHPGGTALGPVRFLLLAQACPLPVLALGGMTRARARRLPVHGWAAIDGLS